MRSDHLLDNALGERGGPRRRGLFNESGDLAFGLLLAVIGNQLALQRLRQFRAVAIERVGLEASFHDSR